MSGAVVTKGDPATIFVGQKKIGQGASGSVYTAVDSRTKMKVAIKKMDLQAQPRKELIINEILVMRESQHDNIVNYVDSYLVSMQLWVVMELMESGPLTNIIEKTKMSEPVIAYIVREVILNYVDLR